MSRYSQSTDKQLNTSVSFQTESSGQSDRGLVREDNQDCIFTDPEMGLYLVLDGMGGHRGGAAASGIARDEIIEVVGRGLGDREPVQLLIEACEAASSRVYFEAECNPELHGMGTTVVGVLMISATQAAVVHVGDSRAYLMRDQELVQLTDDHSVVADLIRRGHLTEEQAEESPFASVLLRNIGGLATTEVEVTIIDVLSGDRILLCSDGLNAYASHRAIEEIVGSSTSVSSTARNLIALAKRGGGGDNVSAIVIEFGEPAQGRLRPLRETEDPFEQGNERLVMTQSPESGTRPTPPPPSYFAPPLQRLSHARRVTWKSSTQVARLLLAMAAGSTVSLSIINLLAMVS